MLTLEQVEKLYKNIKLLEQYEMVDECVEDQNLFHDIYSENISKLYEDTKLKVDTKTREMLETFCDNDGWLDMPDMLYGLNVYFTKFCNESIMLVLNNKHENDKCSLMNKLLDLRFEIYEASEDETIDDELLESIQFFCNRHNIEVIHQEDGDIDFKERT